MSVSVMKKLAVLTPRRDADRLVRRLMRLRCAEITTVPLGEMPDGGELIRYDCDAACAEAERRVADVRAVIPVLDGYNTEPRSWRQRPIAVTAEAFRASGGYDTAGAVVDEVLQIREAQTACRREVERLEGLRDALYPWLDYDAPLEAGTDTCEVWLGSLPPRTPLDELLEGIRNPDGYYDDRRHPIPADAVRALSELCVGIEEVGRERSDYVYTRAMVVARYVSVIVLREDAEAAARELAGIGFVRQSFKGLPLADGTAWENNTVCVRRLGELDNQIQMYTDRLRELSRHLEEVQIYYDMEMTTLTAAREKQKLAATAECVLLEAWVPAERDGRVAAALDRLPCAYEMTEPEEGEEPPVLLRNNGFASNFEWVVGMYAYPKYGTFDPTFIMSIFYFFIFGIMFADVGYGALLILGGFLIPKLLPVKDGLKRMLHMFGYCGISCTLLGFVFGGWFGDLPYALMTTWFGYESAEAAKEAVPFFNGLVVTLGGEPLVFNPIENPILFLIISLVIGGVHLIAGMAIKFWILCKSGDVVGAIFDVGAYWVLFAGIGCIFLSPTVGWILLGVGVLMIVSMGGRAQKNIVMRILMGLKGLYDLISYASDLLSYCRILALGLAAGVVGQVINLLATMAGATPVGFVIMVLVLLVGHALNMAINLLGSFVHTSRLQYLEFFGKFYEDGGVPFEPALPSDTYSTVESETPEEASEATDVLSSSSIS